ncbi:MAG: GNAT family N-acetyltransferase [candidate division Zixibacteria bacterium]|nr:GNAT family N-acetyltransferase [candidate division Zixibacteria bacterium]
MSTIQIRDMDATTEYFVGTCSHVDESDEIDACAKRRIIWLQNMYKRGLRVKVALLDDRPVGFLYVMPIEICPWGPLGKDLMVIPCLFVLNKQKNQGAGSALIAEAEEEARRLRKKGIVTTGYYSDFWFMPAPFFERVGFSIAKRRKTNPGSPFGDEAILWRVFDQSAGPPEFLKPNYQFKPQSGKVVVDLFWNIFCQTSNIEAQRVREVAAEFGDAVVINEYPSDDPAILRKHQLPRGIFINGKEIGWGYGAPRDGIRKAISQALRKNDP